MLDKEQRLALMEEMRKEVSLWPQWKRHELEREQEYADHLAVVQATGDNYYQDAISESDEASTGAPEFLHRD